MTPAQAEKLKASFLDESSYDLVIDHDADGYDKNGKMLFKFRKGAVPLEITKLGYDAFKDAIIWTEGRGTASGGAFKRPRADGSLSQTNVGQAVEAAVVGYMDRGDSGRNRYCRKTAFAKDYFDKFSSGIPFVEYIDKLYSQLCPEHYKKQIAIARGTNRNYRIADTSFTTITVNKNFQTAVHQDAGDFVEGFGNLCVYREGYYEGAYLVLPEYRVAVDLQNTDMLFMDVHKWHGNTAFKNMSEGYLRIAFVMYYRNNMIQCKSPSEELKYVKNYTGGFLKL